MGTEDWVLKGTKLITNTKKQRLKIQNIGWIFKNTILKKSKKKKKKQSHKNYLKNTHIYIYIYEVYFKNRIFFFCKVIVDYKNEN